MQALIRCAKMHVKTETGTLDREHEIKLAYAVQQGLRAKEKLRDNPGEPGLEQAEHDGINAEELLVAGNALLVVSLARAFMRRRHVLDSNLEELVAQGLQGLVVAARNYTNPGQANFAAFAKPTILKFIRSADSSVFGSAAYFDRDDRESVLPSLFATSSRLADELRRPPTMEELSAEFNRYHTAKRAGTGKPVPAYLRMDPERALDMMNVMSPTSMEAAFKADGAESETTLKTLLPDTSEHADTAETAIADILADEAHDLLVAALSSLTETQRRLLLLTFQFGIDPDEKNVLHGNGNVAPGKIARVLGVSPQQIAGIRSKALDQLAEDPSLRDFWDSFR